MHFRTNGLQMALKAAARVWTKTTTFDHILSILAASLHWFSIHVGSDFKVLLMSQKMLSRCSPSYLCDLFEPYIPSHALCSAVVSQQAAGPFPNVPLFLC